MRLTRTIGLPEFTAPKLLRHLFATSLQDANVDPLIRCEFMGHATQATRGSGHPLGMTATYTHSRPETKRRQLESASMPGPAVAVAESWLKRSMHLQSHEADRGEPLSKSEARRRASYARSEITFGAEVAIPSAHMQYAVTDT